MLEYELVNAFYSASVALIMFYVYKIPMGYYVVILGHLAAVFLTNDFLFPVDYMPDQYRYINAASCIRDTMQFIDYRACDKSGNVAFAGLLFASSPMLIINSVFSIGMINFLIYTFLFVFLYKKKILVGNALWFYLLFPSFALYSALSLRETFILMFMIFSIYALYKKKTFLSIVIASPLLLFKAQNFLIFIVALVIYKGIEKGKLFSLKSFFKFVLIAISLVLFSILYPIEELNWIRRSMYAEDGGDVMNYIPITSYVQFFFQGILGAFYMILKPFLWESRSAIQLVQSLENIFVFYIVYKIIKRQYIVKDKFIKFLLIYFFTAMLVYGMVTFNFGTAARYRYTFVVVLVIFSLSIFYKHKQNRKAFFEKN